jgi:hypothetical protein
MPVETAGFVLENFLFGGVVENHQYLISVIKKSLQNCGLFTNI